MTTQCWDLLQDYFNRAVEASPEERQAVLEECKKQHPSLLPELLELLDCDQEPNTEFDRAFSQAHTMIQPALQRFDKEHGYQKSLPIIDDFENIQVIGSGSMGSVFKASQISAGRQVAIKVLKNLESSEAVSRFQNEVRTLAQMKHPNIAQMFLSGHCKDDNPFFAMEFIEGSLITHYCDSHNLNIERRIELFLQVCNGVLHAHQLGIVHRDLKPANILVTEINNNPVVKIIDFGIAKITQDAAFAAPFKTDLGYFMGTPAYMSPEQASMEPIDTRSDIYALGAVLYELLCGCLIIDLDTFYKLGTEERIQVLLNRKPHKASTATIRCEDQQCQQIAKHRMTTCPQLTRTLRGDLDAILTASLENNREDRYRSVSDLQHDLTAYLRREPVKAAKNTKLYLVGKFIRRHKLMVAMATITFFAIIYALIATIVLLRQTTIAKKETETIQSLMVDIMSAAHPDKSGSEVRILDQLKLSEPMLQTHIQDNPNIESGLRYNFALTYFGLGDYKSAERHLRRALVVLPEEVTERRAEILELLARTLNEVESFEESHNFFQKSLETWKEVHNKSHPRYLNAKSGLANHYRSRSFYQMALTTYKDILENYDDSQVTSQFQAVTHSGIASVYKALKEPQQAIENYQKALGFQVAILGEGHTQTLTTRANLARLHVTQASYDKAIPQFLKLLEDRIEILGSQHVRTINTRYSIGNAYLKKGDFQQAKDWVLEALEQYTTQFGPGHSGALRSRNLLATIAFKEKDFSEAAQQYQELIKAYESGQKTQGKSYFIARSNYGETLLELNQADLAIQSFEETLILAKAINWPTPRRIAKIQTLLGKAYMAADKPEKAEPHFKAAYEKLPEVPYALNLAKCLIQQGNVSEAHELLLKAQAELEPNNTLYETLQTLLQQSKVGPE